MSSCRHSCQTIVRTLYSYRKSDEKIKQNQTNNSQYPSNLVYGQKACCKFVSELKEPIVNNKKKGEQKNENNPNHPSDLQFKNYRQLV